MTAKYYTLALPPDFIIFIFVATLLVYNVDRILSIPIDRNNQPVRTNIFQRYRKALLGLTLVLSLLLGFLFWYLYSLWFFVTTIVLFFPTLFYLLMFTGIIPFSKYRSIALIKPILIGAVWAGVSIILPFTLADSPMIPESVWFLLLFRFLLYSLNAALFDLRDLEGDKISGKLNFVLYTNPKNIVYLTLLLTILESIFLILWFNNFENILIGLGEVLTIASVIFLIIFLRRQNMQLKNKELYVLLVDGILFLPLVWVVVFEHLWN